MLVYRYKFILFSFIFYTAFAFQFNTLLLIFSLIYCAILINIQSIVFHRYFSHRSFSVAKWTEFLFVLLSIPIGQGSLLSWAVTHRLHHQHSDSKADPHSPITKSILKIIFIPADVPQVSIYKFKDLIQNKSLLFFHRNYYFLFFCYIGLAYAILSKVFFIYFIIIPVIYINLGTLAINILSHKFGSSVYSNNDHSKNNLFVRFFTFFSEGLHNNHHFNPTSASQSLNGEFDLPYLIIKQFWRKND